MTLEWDDAKRRANLEKHGLDFADAPKLDWDNATVIEDRRKDYPEPRYWRLRCSADGFTSWRSVCAAQKFGLSAFAKPTTGRQGAMDRKIKDRVVPDDDIPEMTAADFRRARLMREVMPEVVEAFKRGRGRPKSDAPKERISLRLDPKVLTAYKSTGPGWQKRIADTLAREAPKAKRRASKMR